jgi:hypothetical protein
MLERPYKFLDFYTADDAPVFAGRDREIDILLSDILATRLVVLYAKTGCGKSSLINAGVRPRLDQLEYPSLLIRVERDPAGSALAALREAGLVAPGATPPAFLAMIKEATAKLEMPLVLFLDQFEEFFVYLPAARQQDFIADLGKLYDDPNSGVHIVLSMREEFFYQLDSFRDHIPRIFHKESNLRLRWLSTGAARQVLERPAEKFGVTFEAEVIDSILTELAEDGWIEPARLQIVCDTLWDRRKGAAIDSALYRQLGGARRILDRRIVDDFDQRLSGAELRALEDTIPALSSTEGTKKIRAVEETLQPRSRRRDVVAGRKAAGTPSAAALQPGPCGLRGMDQRLPGGARRSTGVRRARPVAAPAGSGRRGGSKAHGSRVARSVGGRGVDGAGNGRSRPATAPFSPARGR